MKLLIRKLYCPYCLRLVHGKEQTKENHTIILCGRCGHTIRSWEGDVWKPVKVQL
jgi:transcription elongation factor Elf1